MITRAAETDEPVDLSKYTNDDTIRACLLNSSNQDIKSKIKNCAASRNLKSIQWYLGELYRSGELRAAEFNYKYVAVFFNKPLVWLDSRFQGSQIAVKMTPYECFTQAKQYLFLNEVLDKHPKFIEKACKFADKKQLNAALLQINPEYFEGIKVLLDAGAMVQKPSYDGYSVDDPIGTSVLKHQINDILSKKS